MKMYITVSAQLPGSLLGYLTPGGYRSSLTGASSEYQFWQQSIGTGAELLRRVSSRATARYRNPSPHVAPVTTIQNTRQTVASMIFVKV
ncbi:MAG: hypothetical protein GEV09_00145 [Pseudonocardiaceae bacterium]|nr:hypothetical protein [Pseudonocardiaceae bacterium]